MRKDEGGRMKDEIMPVIVERGSENYHFRERVCDRHSTPSLRHFHVLRILKTSK
jgi:hypothetical protein